MTKKQKFAIGFNLVRVILSLVTIVICLFFSPSMTTVLVLIGLVSLGLLLSWKVITPENGYYG